MCAPVEQADLPRVKKGLPAAATSPLRAAALKVTCQFLWACAASRPRPTQGSKKPKFIGSRSDERPMSTEVMSVRCVIEQGVTTWLSGPHEAVSEEKTVLMRICESAFIQGLQRE